MNELNTENIIGYVEDPKITNVILEQYYDVTDSSTICVVRYNKNSRKEKVKIKIFDYEVFDGTYKNKLKTLSEMM